MNLGLKAAFCALALALAGGPSFAQDATTSAAAQPQASGMIVYDNTLAPGWNNWSWANVTLSFAIGDPSETPIKVESPPWTALYLQHAAFSTAPYTTLTFFVHGGAHGGQTLSVIAIDAQGHAFGDHYFRVVPTAQGWTQVDVPLAELGAANQTVTGFWIQNGSATPATRYYVNDIVLH